MATHSSVLAWRTPWTEEPGGLQSTGSQSQTRLSGLAHVLSTHYCPVVSSQRTAARGPDGAWAPSLARELVRHAAPKTQCSQINFFLIKKVFLTDYKLKHNFVKILIYIYVCMLGVQSCSALCNCMDCSPLVSSVHGIFQARIQQVAITFSMYTYVYMKSKGIPFLFYF